MSHSEQHEVVFKAHCIDQEYWLLRRLRCHCRKAYDSKASMKTLESRASGMVDVFHLRCDDCGRPLTVVFDISSFWGRLEEMFDLDSLNVEEARTRLQQALVERAGGDMEFVLQYLRVLSANGDTPALEYVRAALEHLRTKIASP
jgi:hypothetical protein